MIQQSNQKQFVFDEIQPEKKDMALFLIANGLVKTRTKYGVTQVAITQKGKIALELLEELEN